MPGRQADIAGCIFNLDGVLVNTAQYHFQAWLRLAKQLGFEFSVDQFSALKEQSRMASLEMVLEWGGLYIPEAEKMYWADIKNNLYRQLISEMKPGEVLPGVLLFLRQVRESGIKTAVSSTSQNARAVLESTRLLPFFDEVIDGNAIKKQKPDPQCFMLASEALSLHPEKCLVFDDTTLGINAALSGGFWVAGIGEEKQIEGAHVVVSGLEHLKYNELILQLSKHLVL